MCVEEGGRFEVRVQEGTWGGGDGSPSSRRRRGTKALGGARTGGWGMGWWVGGEVCWVRKGEGADGRCWAVWGGVTRIRKGDFEGVRVCEGG